MRGRPGPWHFGLRGSRFWSAVGWMLLAYVGYVVVAATCRDLGIKSQEDLPRDLGVDSSTFALVSVAILVTVVAPVAEEFFFRGYFFTALRNWKGRARGDSHGSYLRGHPPRVSAVGVHPAARRARRRPDAALLAHGLAVPPASRSIASTTASPSARPRAGDWQIPVLAVGAGALITLLLLPFRGSSPLKARAPAYKFPNLMRRIAA